jgi:hypothetical protein
MTWPLQSQCDSYYGNPRGRNGGASPVWEKANLTRITPPFKMQFAGKPITSISINKKCADSLSRVFEKIWEAAEKNQKIIDDWGVSVFSGSYNYRVMRGGNVLSMHAYGCAIDLDAPRNWFHDQDPHFAKVPQVLKAFADEGWTWGGSWSGRSKDGMHFQAARVG